MSELDVNDDDHGVLIVGDVNDMNEENLSGEDTASLSEDLSNVPPGDVCGICIQRRGAANFPEGHNEDWKVCESCEKRNVLEQLNSKQNLQEPIECSNRCCQ